MSSISDIYDALRARILVALPDHKELPNAYQIEENNEQFLQKGFAIGFGAGENSQRQLSCQLSIRMDFQVVLTRRVYSLENTRLKRAEVEKDLFEDQMLLISDIESDPTLGSACVANAQFLSHNGNEFVFGEKDNFLKLESVFSIEYFEDLA